MRLIVVFSALAIAKPQMLMASCGFSSIKQLRADNEILPVFRGTVIHIEPAPNGRTIEFQVRRVWKGHVGKRFVMYQLSPQTALVEGQDWFVVGYRQWPVQREKMGIPPNAPETFSLDCLTMPFDSPDIQRILMRDRGRSPE